MEDKITELYSEAIMKLNRKPFHFEKYGAAQHIIEAYNPLCGDKFKLFLDINDGIVTQAYFHGYGCAVSKASTSVLVSHISGCPVSEAIIFIEKFLESLDHSSTSPPHGEGHIPVDWQAFSAVNKFPERLSCVTLSWESSKLFLLKQL